MQSREGKAPWVVPTSDFHRYVPGKRILASDASFHKHLILSDFSFPTSLGETPAPATPDYAIGVTNKGAVRGPCRINGKLYKSQSLIAHQTCTLLSPMHDISWAWQPLTNNIKQTENIVLHLSHKLFQQNLTETYDKEFRCIEQISKPSVEDPLVVTIVHNIRTEYSNRNPLGSLYIDAALNMLVVHLLSHHCSYSYKPIKDKGGLDPLVLCRVIDYVRTEFNQNISLDTLASLANMSGYHFARSFKKSMGLTPHQYLLQCRIDRARELLSQTQLSVAQVALAVGYGSVSHFSTLFRRITGFTPISYRRAHI